jgi:hypothetical protein
MSANNAPVTIWRAYVIGAMKRQRLYVNGRETPYFVDTALAAYARTYGEKHALFGSGMSAAGTAACLGFGRLLAPLKHKAEQLALEAA